MEISKVMLDNIVDKQRHEALSLITQQCIATSKCFSVQVEKLFQLSVKHYMADNFIIITINYC